MPTLRIHTHLQAAQADTNAKACKRVCPPNAEKKNYFLKSLLSKNFKTADTKAKKIENEKKNDNKSTEIQLLDNDGGQKASLQNN